MYGNNEGVLSGMDNAKPAQISPLWTNPFASSLILLGRTCRSALVGEEDTGIQKDC